MSLGWLRATLRDPVSAHKGYKTPADGVPPKYGPQFAGPYKIVERVGRAAYRLELPPNSKIHGVISIDHLEPYELDPFGRSLPYAGPVRAERHERKIVAERETRGQRKQYLIEYLGLGQEFREWKSATQVGADAADMIDDFRRRQPPLRKDGGYGVAVTW